MTAERILGHVEGPDKQQLDVRAIVQTVSRAALFAVHVEPAPSGERQWAPIWTGTRAMQLRQHEPAPPYSGAVLELITPEVWAWAWREALTNSQRRVTWIADDLRLAELELLAARAHTGGLPARTAQVVASLVDGWTGTAEELLEAASLIDQEIDHG